MTPQETEQFAALRMHVAHLHNALKVADGFLGPAEALNPEAYATIQAALAQSEPEVRDLLAEADRDAKLVACRAELQSQGQTLAQVTARLSTIEAKAMALVAAYDSEARSNNETILPLEVVVDLAEALK